MSSKDSYIDEKQHNVETKSDQYDHDSYLNEDGLVTVTDIKISPSNESLLEASLDLMISFELSRSVSNASWKIQFLVDSCDQRILKILSQSEPVDYDDGESDAEFHIDKIDISGITPSQLANSGLLMAVFMIDNQQAISINLVVNVYQKQGRFYREILNPLE